MGLYMAPPNLGLYVHIPWCVRKCPYCDFNSHAVRNEIDEGAYIKALLADLKDESQALNGRAIGSIFIGGGTPSLFSAQAIGQLLEGAEKLVPFVDDIEITLEANPGAADAQRFAGYRSAGVNRISLGIQSLQDDKLTALGRIHTSATALAAVDAVKQAGFDNVNLDIMYGLPNQSLEEAMLDLSAVVALNPPHLSWYQLTLEPNTLFYQQPPAIPEDDALADMMDAGLALLAGAGYQQYEISAHSQAGKQCQHNLNYWQFGNYIGIGAGAHGKLTLADGKIIRRSKQRHPERYLQAQNRQERISQQRRLSAEELPLEFMLNAMRLNEGVPIKQFQQTTGLEWQVLKEPLQQAQAKGLVTMDAGQICPTQRGRLFLNDLLALF
jgi:putative oxygen-independent coproporphyrinogen III oxidase